MSRVGTMPTRSNSLRAMIENSASPLPEAIAPTDAVEAEITPATGACTVICPPSGSVSRASTWPAVTVSPASTITSATFSPIRSGRTWFSSRGMMVPDTSTILAKQDFAALSTVTAAPFGGGLGSSAARSGRGKQAEHPRCDQGGQRRRKVARAQDGHRHFVPGFGLNRYQKADRGAKRQEVTPAPG